MKNTSTGQNSAKIKREIKTLKKMPDSDINFSDMPLQDPNDPKWKHAVVGKFYRPIKKPVALRIDADVLDWLKSNGAGYQSRINQILRREMMKLTESEMKSPASSQPEKLVRMSEADIRAYIKSPKFKEDAERSRSYGPDPTAADLEEIPALTDAELATMYRPIKGRWLCDSIPSTRPD